MHMKCTSRGRRMVIKPPSVSWLHGGEELKLLARISPQTALLNHKDNHVKYGVQRRGFRSQNMALILTFYLKHIFTLRPTQFLIHPLKFLSCMEKTSLIDFV